MRDAAGFAALFARVLLAPLLLELRLAFAPELRLVPFELRPLLALAVLPLPLELRLRLFALAVLPLPFELRLLLALEPPPDAAGGDLLLELEVCRLLEPLDPLEALEPRLPLARDVCRLLEPERFVLDPLCLDLLLPLEARRDALLLLPSFEVKASTASRGA